MKIESTGSRLILFAFICIFIFLIYNSLNSKRESKIIEILSNSEERDKIEKIFEQKITSNLEYRNLSERTMCGVDVSGYGGNIEDIIHSKIYDIFVYADESGVNAVKVRAANNSSFIWMINPKDNIHDYVNSLDKIRSTHGKFTSISTRRD